MLKKVIILVVLSATLVVLLFVRSQQVSNDPAKYIMVEYEITNIKQHQYFGKAKDGTEIRFSDKDIPSGEEIKVHDIVICYFEKDNFGEGLVKVEIK